MGRQNLDLFRRALLGASRRLLWSEACENVTVKQGQQEAGDTTRILHSTGEKEKKARFTKKKARHKKRTTRSSFDTVPLPTAAREARHT